MDDAIGLLGEIVENEPNLTDDEIVWTLTALGFYESVARRLTIFVPLALGRLTLAELGVTCPDTYCGEQMVARALADEPEFVAGTAAAQWLPDVQRRTLSARSAEVRGVQAAMRNGSDPTDLLLAPVAVRL